MKTPNTDKWRYRRKPYAQQREEDSGWYAIAAAIVRQAVDDWREAERLERGLVKNSPTNLGSPAAAKYEIKKFLHSQWYGVLCDIDPNRILRKLKEEDNERDRVR